MAHTVYHGIGTSRNDHRDIASSSDARETRRGGVRASWTSRDRRSNL